MFSSGKGSFTRTMDNASGEPDTVTIRRTNYEPGTGRPKRDAAEDE
jgi:hypothetical protein